MPVVPNRADGQAASPRFLSRRRQSCRIVSNRRNRIGAAFNKPCEQHHADHAQDGPINRALRGDALAKQKSL
jgi:hypothetical protein